ncbi:SixA phosphatase family protein [Pseudactinotalea terrae]|uniref:SixA phosphatase family protein n=1 Tax=Pseudactinotalea terrae TaxID=1743262 RepID=UPI0012E15181|nr:histidine phosphatase family protein [Pseudactinotalea terrae]
MPGARRISLLRHAKAGARDTPDHGRELTREGRAQCAQVAEHLLEHGRVPQLVLCSTATRTRQTWELVAAGLGESSPVRFLDVLYSADVSDAVDVLTQVPGDVTEVLVVGHEPTVSETAHHLAGAGSEPGALALVRIGVPTASLSLLHTDAPWSDLARGSAVLTAVLTSPHR